MRHPGAEYGYVLSGRLGVQLGFERHELGPGDSIAFDATMPHRLWNLGDEAVHGIWFVVGSGGDQQPRARELSRFRNAARASRTSGGRTARR
jgi:quercetin dioxygenase-like cupin family protein